MKLYLVVVIALLLVGTCATFFYQSIEKKEDVKVYQGPVRPTDDEVHFRKTGQTIPLEVKE